MAKSENKSPSAHLSELLTLKEVNLLLESSRRLGNDVVVRSFTLRDFSEEKLGFLGSHKQLQVSYTRDGSAVLESCNFFVKAVPFETPSQAKYVLERGLFAKEAEIFRELMPRLNCGFSETNWCPTCYYATENLLVFEDLRDKKFVMRDKLLDEEHLTSALVALAKFHAASILAEARCGCPLTELHPNVFVEQSFLQGGLVNRWFNAGVDVAVAIAEKMGLDAARIPQACDAIYTAIKPSKTKRNVASHGDLWANNLMFDDNSPPNCIIIDFQLMRYTCIACDFMQLMHLCTMKEFRDRRLLDMARLYYTTLCDVLRINDCPTKDVPSWSELVEGMEEQRLAGVITAVQFFPSVLMNGKVCAKVLKDPADYTQYTHVDRRDVVMECMKNDVVYRERIEDCVRELAELALKIDCLPVPT